MDVDFKTTLSWMNVIRKLKNEGLNDKEVLKRLFEYGKKEEVRITEYYIKVNRLRNANTSPYKKIKD